MSKREDVLPRLNIDFGEVQDFDPVPTDRYTLKFSDARDAKPSSNKGVLQKLLGFTITDGEYQGRMIWDWFNLEGKGAFLFKSLCEKAGLDAETVEAFETDEEIEEALINADPVEADVVIDEWEGQEKNVIKRVYEAA